MADDAFVSLLKHWLSQLDCEILFLRHEIEKRLRAFYSKRQKKKQKSAQVTKIFGSYALPT